jgi:hypothetical protein
MGAGFQPCEVLSDLIVLPVLHATNHGGKRIASSFDRVFWVELALIDVSSHSAQVWRARSWSRTDR